MKSAKQITQMDDISSRHSRGFTEALLDLVPDKGALGRPPGLVKVLMSGIAKLPCVRSQYSASTRPDTAPGMQVSLWLLTLSTLQGTPLMCTVLWSGCVVLKPMEEGGALTVKGLPPCMEPVSDDVRGGSP